MRIYSGMLEAFKETERELVEMGTIVHPETMQDKISTSDEFSTKELQGYSYMITDHLHKDEDFIALGGNYAYAITELWERLSQNRHNPGKAYLHRKEVWEEFLHNGEFSYTYNERTREQLLHIINELEQRPNTRQAVLTIYDRHQDMKNMGGKARIPCSMYYQFLRRARNSEERVDCIYTMRSCDIYTHFIYDMYITMRIQEYIANSLGLGPGNFTHFIGSLHAYKKDYEKRGVF